MKTNKERNAILRYLFDIFNKKYITDNDFKLEEGKHFVLNKTYLILRDWRINDYEISRLNNFLNSELKKLDWYIDEEKYTKLSTFYIVVKN